MRRRKDSPTTGELDGAPRSVRRRTRLPRRARGPSPEDAISASPPRWGEIGRLAQVLLGLFSVGFAVVVLASPQISPTGLLLLLAEAVGLISAQTILAGGRLLTRDDAGFHLPRSWRRRVQSLGIVGVGLVALGLAAFAVLDPALAETAALAALSLALVSQGFGRVLQGTGVDLPRWLRGSTLGTGVLSVLLVLLAIAFNGFALTAFAILVGVILIITGVETVVAGLHPTDPRQFVLLKLVLFSAFYGLILINWIDLYGKSVPAYGVWLILTYMAPFGVLIVFEGWQSWPLATSLGLLVSLNNDLGYFFVGNLIFGFHVPLGPWIAGQLGLEGSTIVTTFDAGRLTFDVTSWMMGLSIYVRAAVVGLILYYWWQHPGEIVARSAPPPAAT
ncbi:MAG: hypothetical protein L3K07_00010 [Thermoplasmata archaeon]|nr:hypothetical protein [Thermoplasmata archaeon]